MTCARIQEHLVRSTQSVPANFRPWEILIPPGVGHGYKALGVEPVQLPSFTDRHYNSADELRITYNDPAIGYDWETQHK